MLNHGYVRDHVDKADKLVLDGRTTGIWTDDPSFIVHPEAGKWLIALGEKAFGMDPFGWRIASAVVGALMVLVMVRLARRLTGSTALGCVAGLLLCFDGLHLVLSRLALLDIFVAFFVLCGVACLVNDRDWFRTRLAPPGAGRRAAGLRSGTPRAAPPVAAAGRGVVRAGGRHQVDGPLPAGRVRPAGVGVELRRAAPVRGPARGAPLGARGRRTRVLPAGRRRLPGLRRHLDRLAGQRPRVRGPPLLDAVHPLRPPGRLQGRLRRRRPVALGARAGRLRSRRAGAVTALAVELPPGRLRLPRPLPQLLRPHLPVAARPGGCC